MCGYRIIKKASIAVLSICGEQIYDANQQYHISNFVIVINEECGQLFHSCLTGELVEVTDRSEAYQYLISHWFLVGHRIDEKSMAYKIKRLMRCWSNHLEKGYKTIEIVTTTKCNARCYYCYEQSFKPMTMSKETANRAVDFIFDHIFNKTIRIKWYGGEPLMNIPVIDIISKGLLNKGISITSTMISNGLLFSEEVIKKAKNIWHLLNARITLDGTAHFYNKTKRYMSCPKNAFQLVLNNIDNLLNNGISVTIRLNVEIDNMEDVKDLLHFLCEKYRGYKNLDFMIRPLNNTNSNKEIESFGDIRNYILELIMLMKSQLVEDGFSVNCGKLSGMTFSTCAADSGKYVLIKPNGELAYCSTDFDTKAYGSIYDESKPILCPQLSKYPCEKGHICGTCPIYPLCNPSRLCPSCVKPICNEIQKKSNILDVVLNIKQYYRNYKERTKINEN